MSPIFRVFGAPHTFDLYQGKVNEIGYFQNFDNGSKENVKLTIHRMESGKVSYSYLRYNIISGGGRHNSFLGMSIIFNNEYCQDIERIFGLFDTIYDEVILRENGKLLAAVKDDPKAQAKYLVRAFSEVDNEVRLIERNIIVNLEKHFANEILPLDPSFVQSNTSIKLNKEMGNAVFLTALHQCSWVHISPEYKIGDPDSAPSPDFLAGLDRVIDEILKDFPNLSIKVLKERKYIELDKAIKKVDESKIKIEEWLLKQYELSLNESLQKQPELKKRYNELCDIYQKLYDLKGITTEPKDSSVPVPDPETDKNDSGRGQKPPRPTRLWIKYGGGIAAFALIAFSLWHFHPGGDKIPDTNLCDELTEKVESLFAINEFSAALAVCKSDTLSCDAIAGYQQRAKDSLFMRNEYKAAIEEYNKGGLIAGEKGTAQNKAYSNAISKFNQNLLETVARDTVIQRLKIETKVYYEEAIKSSASSNDKKKYAGYIIEELGISDSEIANSVVNTTPVVVGGGGGSTSGGVDGGGAHTSVTITIKDFNGKELQNDIIESATKGAKYTIHMENHKSTDYWAVDNPNIVEIGNATAKDTHIIISKEGTCELQLKDVNHKVIKRKKLEIKNLM